MDILEKLSHKMGAGFSNTAMAIILLGLFSGMLGACGESTNSKIAPDQPSSSPSVLKSSETTKTADPSAAIHPVTDDTRNTYQWYCAQCHGIEGKGNGINAKHVTVPPRNHTKPDYLETRSDEELFNSIKLGGLKVGRAPCMPSWGNTLEDSMIWSLVRYIRELCHCEAI